MGIKLFNTLMPYVDAGIGIDRSCVRDYAIYCDGSNILHKGLPNEVSKKSNMEQEAAQLAADNLCRTIRNIETYIGRTVSNVYVYMDGPRIKNKELRPKKDYDLRKIKTCFVRECKRLSLVVQEQGEAELQMYLNRNQNNHLNVFVTTDSDMLSICCDHEPIIKKTNTGEIVKLTEDIRNMLHRNIYCSKSRPDSLDRITNNLNAIDNNVFYKTEDICDILGTDVTVHDSCLWLKLSSKSELKSYFISMDLYRSKFMISDRVFRAFLALCGTDYTNDLLTPTLRKGFFKLSDKEREIFNSTDDWNEIITLLLYVGVRSKGTIKRTPVNDKNYDKKFDPFSEDRAFDMLDIYYNYITTGIMKDVKSPRPNMIVGAHHYLEKMFGDEVKNKTKNKLVLLANSLNLKDVLEAYRLRRQQSSQENSISNKYDILKDFMFQTASKKKNCSDEEVACKKTKLDL